MMNHIKKKRGKALVQLIWNNPEEVGFDDIITFNRFSLQ